ncbi:DUF3099 domain-containing protein [Paenarthrobacter nitroguajacolicus]|uniref:DUF3099 domain-containing protein n=1 Tax=Paenarthrobacter nitroguajacolicus TaxID=211146 RepID=UPI004054673D
MERDDSVVTRENSPLQQVPGEPDPVSSDPEVHSITDAAAAHSEDMRDRMIKYAVAMGIRMVCIVLIFVVDGWFKIIAIAGAVFLPWIAVVIANGNDKAEDHSESLLDYVTVPEIERSSEPEQNPADAPTVLQGEVVDDEPPNKPAEPPAGQASEAGHPGDERAAS